MISHPRGRKIHSTRAADKGPSTFDVAHAFTASVIQDLHADRMSISCVPSAER